MKKFAQQLGTYIDSSGVKQTRLAASAGISYNYLQRLLSGSRHPSDQVVYKLAEALRLSAEQTGDLLAAAGYAPPMDLLTSTTERLQAQHPLSISPVEMDDVTRTAQQFYKLAREIPEESQSAFLEEMRHLLGYTRYKYVLSRGMNILDLSNLSIQAKLIHDTGSNIQDERSQLDIIAQLVGELNSDSDEELKIASDENSHPPQEVEDMLSAIDRLIGNILSGGILAERYQSQVVLQTFDMLRHGTPWEIRRRIAEALPSLLQLDVTEAEHLMEVLRLDLDELRGADIRRRVIEALPDLFNASPQYLPNILQLLQPVKGDDIYVALATAEICEDIQGSIQQLLREDQSLPPDVKAYIPLLQKSQVEISRLQRQLLLSWDGMYRESLQFAMSLHNLLCAPDTLLISLREGLQSTEKLTQFVAARYLERLLPLRPMEALEAYRMLQQATQKRNVRRTVAKALPKLLQSLNESSLPVRALAREVISTLAVDPDIHIRRAVADHSMQVFHIDREFLLVLLRLMHKDTDRVIRHRLQPVALRLAQVWLTWYAETAGLVDTKRSRNRIATSFGE